MTPLPSPRWVRWAGLALLALGVMAGGCRQTRELLHERPTFKDNIRILIWKNYLPPDVIFDFEDEFGIGVVVEYFDSNDQLLDRLANNALPDRDQHYDLVMPSSFKAKEMKALLSPLTAKNIPNLTNLDTDAYNSKFDLTNEFFVPYIWGSTGIGYRSDAVDGIPKSWANFFLSPAKIAAAPAVVVNVPPGTTPPPDPAKAGAPREEIRMTNDQHTAHNKKRRIALLDDARFTLGCALIYLKHPLETAGEKEIQEAADLIRGIADEVVYIDGDNVPGLLARKELEMDMVMAWSGDVTRAMRGFAAPDETQKDAHPKKNNVFIKNTQVRLALPTEGTLLFRDGFAVPKGANNQKWAEEFINFLLRPEIAGRVTNYSDYANTLRQEKVMPFVDRFVTNGASYFTHPAGSKFNFTFDDIPPEAEAIYRTVWKNLKASIPVQPYPEIKEKLYPAYPLTAGGQ
jgi:spermidine/putrescine transport system substrate-binding protein